MTSQGTKAYVERLRLEWRSVSAYAYVRCYRLMQEETRQVIGSLAKSYGHIRVEETIEAAGGWPVSLLGLAPATPCDGEHREVGFSRAFSVALTLASVVRGLHGTAQGVRHKLEKLAAAYGSSHVRSLIQAAGGWDRQLMGDEPPGLRLMDEEPVGPN